MPRQNQGRRKGRAALGEVKRALRVKRSVEQASVRPAIWFAVGIAYVVFLEFGIRARITSLTDTAPGRKPDSLHPLGLAVDLGARGLDATTRKMILQRLKDRLEPLGYDIVLHGTPIHYHIEYQLKPKETGWQEIVET